MRIEFKEERTKVTEEDLMQREKIAKDLLLEANSSKDSFQVIQAKYKDIYENVYV